MATNPHSWVRRLRSSWLLRGSRDRAVRQEKADHRVSVVEVSVGVDEAEVEVGVGSLLVGYQLLASREVEGTLVEEQMAIPMAMPSLFSVSLIDTVIEGQYMLKITDSSFLSLFSVQLLFSFRLLLSLTLLPSNVSPAISV